MATITLSLSGSSLAPNVQVNKTISDTDLQTVLNYVATLPSSVPGMTNTQLLAGWVTQLFVDQVYAIGGWQRSQAANAAAAAVTPISIT